MAQKIYLALSGGGFRATIFHLGVLRYLRDYGLLPNVVAISSVSGGSITAAHAVMNWPAYKGTGHAGIDACQNEIHRLAACGLRERLVRRIGWYWLLRVLGKLFRRPHWDKNITTRLADYYTKYLFPQKSTLSDLKNAHVNDNAPSLYLMTSNLTFHTSRTHFNLDDYVYQDPTAIPAKDRTVPVGGYPIGKAVAASSAFPFLFPPARLGYDDPDVNVHQRQLQANAHFLTDGGVFENLGISVLRDVISDNQRNGVIDPKKDTVILLVSDAGRRLDWDLDHKSSRNVALRLLRSSEVSQYWSERRLDVGNLPNEVVLAIDDAINTKVIVNAPSPQVQHAIANLRTDFDAFSGLEWTALFSQGYSVAKSKLATISPAAPVTPNSYSPWQPDGVDWQDQKTAERLGKGKARSAHLFSLTSKDWLSLVNFAVVPLLLLGAYLVAPPSIRRIDQFYASVADWARGDFGSTSIGLEKQIASPSFQFDKFEPFNRASKQAQHEVRQIITAYTAYVDKTTKNETPHTKAVLLLYQRTPFPKGFSTIRRKLIFQCNAKIEQGTAFLLNTNTVDDSTGIRSIPMLKHGVEKQFSPTGQIVIPKPNSGEFLAMVLIVEPLSVNDPSKFPGDDPSQYSLTLEAEKQ